jgi:hypothetical protein
MAQALCESSPQVGSSKKRSNLGWQRVIMNYPGAGFYFTYLGCELHSDGHSFPVFDAERAHNGIGIFLRTALFRHRVDAKRSPLILAQRYFSTITHFASFSERHCGRSTCVLRAQVAVVVLQRRAALRARFSEPDACPSVEHTLCGSPARQNQRK